MKRNPLIPFAVTAVVGILLIISLSFIALNETKEEAGGGEAKVLTAEEAIKAGNCTSCHGGNLEGGNGIPALKDVGSRLSKDDIAKTIKEGKGIMPSFQGQFSPETIENLATWLSEKK